MRKRPHEAQYALNFEAQAERVPDPEAQAPTPVVMPARTPLDQFCMQMALEVAGEVTDGESWVWFRLCGECREMCLSSIRWQPENTAQWMKLAGGFERQAARWG